MSATPLRVGIIGTGDFAAVCHIPGVQSHPQARVVAVSGRRLEAARALADRFGIPDVHADYRELCARPDVDAITIVTPNVYHEQQVLAAVEHRKHVLCEKPLAMTVAEAERMLAAAESAGIVHMVAFTYRYLYGVRELRRRIRAGEIGEPFYVRMQYDSWSGFAPDRKIGWRDQTALAGGGMLYDIGSHLFDISRFLFGPLETAAGFRETVCRPGAAIDPDASDDLAAAWYRHESGIRGQWFVSRVTPPFTRNGFVEVAGPSGALRASLSRGSIDVLERSTPTQPDWQPIPLDPAASDGSAHALGRMMRAFVDACLQGKPDGAHDATFHDGLAVQRAIAAVDSRC
jgi:predicted dehydrogenase